MSSHTVATSVRGLPDAHSPVEDVHPFGASLWPSHVSPDPAGTTTDDTIEFPALEESVSHHVRSPSWSGLNVQERNEALGNLLAALVPAGSQNLTTVSELNRPETKGYDQKSSAQDPEDDVTLSLSQENPINMAEDLPLLDLTHDLPTITTSNNDLSNGVIHDPFSMPLHSDEVAVNGIDETDPNPIVQDNERQPVPDRREIEAFAKIEFEDGNYYITTYAVELGRDALAYKTALARAEEEKEVNHQGQGKSSSGRASRPSDRVRRHGDSQVQGSVVSEAGGFGGVDDDLVLRDQQRKESTGDRALSSQSSIVKPAEVLINPPHIPFDYHKNAERQAQMEMDDEQPAPVTADHLPKTDTCPLIPIHATTNTIKTEVDTHKGISRRHVKIQWDWDKECFTMRVLGRNGAFLDEVYLPQGSVKRLDHGSKIQISDVSMSFRLPRQTSDPPVDDSDDVGSVSGDSERSVSPTGSIDGEDNDASPVGKRAKTRITLTTGQKAPTPSSESQIGPDGQPLAPRKRGPGRPPKDGIMSTRERREREKAQKLAEAKAANGGKTPPPMLKGKFPKPLVPEEPPKVVETKAEKRKYKKRKRIGEDGEVLPSIEGEEVDLPSEPEKPPVKKSRASKSPSPEYPPVEALTEEQLARPSEPYARLIYDILIEIHPTALPLKQIYRALKRKFPFFVYRVDSEGWQSSVRHNLNQEWNKLFEKGEKEGKGFAWKAIPGALQPQAERKRAAQQAAASKPKPQATARTQVPPQGPPPPLHWQNSTPFMPQNGQPPYFQQYPPPNGMPWPPPPPQPGQTPIGTPASSATGQIQTPGQAPAPFYPPQAPNRPPFASASPLGPGKPPPQIPGRPPAGQPQHPNAPPPPPPGMAGTALTSSSSASRNMPCTIDGVMAIKRFENAMYQQVESSQGNVDYWHQIFASVKSRLLHGAPESSMPGGETKEETTIMEHVRNFIERFKNPNFEGFRLHANASSSRTVSPALNSPSAVPPVPVTSATTSAPSIQQSPPGPENSPRAPNITAENPTSASEERDSAEPVEDDDTDKTTT